MSDLTEPPKLNPAQQQVTDDLGAKREDRPAFRDDLREHLRHEVEETLAPLLTEVTELPLFVSKRHLSMLHSCEARFVAEQDIEFAWTVPMARGSVAHKAIELLVTWRGEPTPLELVEHAMARLEYNERGVGPFLSTLDEAERAELTGQANDFVATFIETFPPINRRWVPVAESKVRAELCEDQLALQGRVDLSLGRADGNVAGKVLIDLKTGRPSMSHIDDLRFYALLETLKVGTPPRLAASYYLDQGRFVQEPITEAVLDAAIARLVRGAELMVELLAENGNSRAPVKRTSPGCSWCPLLEDCREGQDFLQADDDY